MDCPQPLAPHEWRIVLGQCARADLRYEPAASLLLRNGRMGFNLWRMSFFKDDKLRKPWFKTVFGAEGLGTQDLYFWGDARKYGHRCAIDTRVKVGHYDLATDLVW